MSHDKLAELLSAYLDGEVTTREREFVEREIARDDAARAMLADMQQVRKLNASLPRQRAPESLAGDVLRMLERDALLGGAGETQYEPVGTWRPWRVMLSMAATIAIVLTGGWWFVQPDDPRGVDGVNQVAMVTKEKEMPAAGDRVAHTLAKKSTHDVRRARRRSLSPTPSESKKMKASLSKATFTDEVNDSLSLDQSAGGMSKNGHAEQRLAAGELLSFLQTHSFEQEPVRMQLVLRDATQLKKVRAAFKKQLGVQGLVDADISATVATSEALQAQSFYYEGRMGGNFQGKNQSQMLIRIPASGMQTLLASIAGEGIEDKNVTLSAGPLVVQGLAQAQSSLSHFRPAQPIAKSDAAKQTKVFVGGQAKNSPSPINTKDADIDIIAEMIKAIGLPLDVLTMNTTSAGEGDGPSKTVAERDFSMTERNLSKPATSAVGSTLYEDHVLTDAAEVGFRQSPLVERREAVLRKNAMGKREKMSVNRDDLLSKKPPTDEKLHTTDTVSASQPFITLVVEFVVPPKEKPRTGKPAKLATPKWINPSTTKPVKNPKTKPTQDRRPKE